MRKKKKKPPVHACFHFRYEDRDGRRRKKSLSEFVETLREKTKKKKKIALHKLQRVNFSRTVGLEILFPVYAVVRLRLISEYVLGKSCKRINGKWNRGVSGQSKSLVCAEFP